MESWLTWFLRGVLVLTFLFLVGRLFELQIVKSSYFKLLSNENRIKRVEIPAPRGLILARGGEILVGNRLDKRYYPLGSKFAHAGGYLSEADETEVGKIDPKCPEKGPRKLGDLLGRGGLEEEYNCLLKGTDGEELIEVDIRGNPVRVLGKKEPIPGLDLKTNIDFNLQNKIPDLFENKKGVAIVTDTKGEVLAFYSSPSFDPNNVAKSLNDPNLPLFNRALGGLYHPGSVFKPVVAIAGLTEGKIDKNYIFVDPGIVTIGKFSYSNWYFSQYGRTEGAIDITKAIARSTDTFFYKLGEMVGIDKIAEYAGKLGLSEITGIDLPGEIAGLIPTPEWRKKATGEDWFLGNTYHVSIGQGDVSVTPIALNQAITVIASDGTFCKPRLVGNGQCRDLKIKKEILDLVKEGMIKACSTGGTGYTFFDFAAKNSGKTVACKTGTAETNEDGKTHAWFTVMTPADFPEIVVTVLFERGGEGATVAGPIARKIIDDWELSKNP